MPVLKERDQEEYEIIPISPLRRLEKRIEQLENTSPVIDIKEVFKEVVDIVRMNQQLVDELTKANDALRIELSKIPPRLMELINNLNELLAFIKASANEEEETGPSGESIKPLADKLDVLIETNKKIIEKNQAILTALEDLGERLKRPTPPPLPMRRSLLPTKKL
ncbi:MAG: hypothetical protein ACTSV6_04110 [Candidatus Heimdallarchaeota archaeon]